MGELVPGSFTRVFTRVALEGDARMGIALGKLSIAVETKTKQNLGQSSHPYGTPTPATPGGPPALVSGTLRRSITHTPVLRIFAGWESKVGTGVGFFGPYPRRGRNGGAPRRTASSKYGYYLETGLRNGATYKFLEPAMKYSMAVTGPLIWQQSFRSGRW